MSDEKSSKKGEALKSLEKLKNDACETVTKLKTDIQTSLSEIKEKDESFEDIEADLDNLEDDLEELLNNVQDLFEKAEIKIQSSDVESVQSETVIEFQSEKSAMRSKTFSLQSRFKEIKRAYSKLNRSREQDKKYKTQLQDSLRNRFEQVKMSVENFNTDIQGACSSEINFEDIVNMKKDLKPIQETIQNQLNNLEEKLERALLDIEYSGDKSAIRDTEKIFEQERDSLQKEIILQKSKVGKLMHGHSTEVRASSRERIQKKQHVIDKLTKTYKAKAHIANSFKQEIDKWVASVQTEFDDRNSTQSKLDELQNKLQDILEKLDGQLDIAKLRIEDAKDTLAEHECLAKFQTDTHTVEREIREVKITFEKLVEGHTQLINSIEREKQQQILNLQNSLIKERDDVKLSVEEIENMIDRMMPKLETRELKHKLQKVKEESKRQISDLNQYFETSFAKAAETSLEIKSQEEIISAFRDKKVRTEAKLKTMFNSCQEINDENAKHINRKQQAIKEYQKTLKTILDETLSPAIDLKTEIGNDLTVENNINEKRKLQRLDQELKMHIDHLKRDFDTAYQKTKNSDPDDGKYQEDIELNFQKKCNDFDLKVNAVYDKMQEIHEQQSKKMKIKQQKLQQNIKTLLTETKRRANELKEDINRLHSSIDNTDEKLKLNQIRRDVQGTVNDIDECLDDIENDLSETNINDNVENEITTKYHKKNDDISSKINELHDVVQAINKDHSNMLKIEDIKNGSVEQLKSKRDNIRKSATDFRENLNQIIHQLERGDLKQRLQQILKELENHISDIQTVFETTKLKLTDSKVKDSASIDQSMLEFNDKIRSIEQKISKNHEKMIDLLEKYSESNQKQEELKDKLKTNYDEFKNITCQLQQSIEGVLSQEDYIDKEDMESELNHVGNKLKEIIIESDEAYLKEKSKIEKTDDIGEKYESLMLFKTKSDQLKSELVILQEKFKQITTFYNISDHAVLARSIRSIAMQNNLQLDNENGHSVYKLPFQQTHIVPAEKLRRFELGKIAHGKDHRHIILVGMTGSGKSLLINNMINYIYGVSHRDKFRFKLIVEKEEIGERVKGASTSKADSMTSWVSSFTLHWQDGFRIPFSLTIIDTPGFGDTRGLKYDEEIVGQIRKFFNDDKLCPNQEMSSIGLLIQASQARITEEQKYIFDQVLNLFGKDMKDNIFIIFTFADAQPPPALEVVKSNQIPHSKTFKFNNSAVYAPNDDELSEYSWEFGYSNLKDYFDALAITHPISLGLTRKVLDEREQLRLILGNLQIEITDGMETLRLIEDQSTTIVNMDGSIRSKKDFKVKKKTFNCVMRDVNYFITNCSACNFTCHEPCQISGDMKQGCAAMREGACIVCPSKCPYDMHTNGNKVYDYTPIEVEETIEDMMKEYNVAVDEKGAKKKLLMGMLSKYEQQKASVFNCIQKANECSNRLEVICLRNSYLTNVEYIERLIESEERSSRPHKADRLIQLRHLKDMAETLRDVKNDPQNLPCQVNDYETKIVEIIQNIKDDDDDPDTNDDSGNENSGDASQSKWSTGLLKFASIFKTKSKDKNKGKDNSDKN